jgi:asparagine synthase (glutamine-hydrolysing)
MQLPPEVRRVLAALTPARRLPDLRQWLEGLAAGRPLPIHLPLGLTRYHRARVLADPTYATRIGWAPSDTTLPRGRRGLRTQLMLDTQDYEFRLRLPELLLMRIDRFSMANGVEARVPFLDPELVQYVYHLPLEYKLRDGIGKVLLRDAVRDIVPGWVLARRKQGFGAPVITWLGSHMGVLFDSLATSEPIRRYFNVEILRRAMTTFGGRSTHGLWPILNFALWHRRWIEGEPLEPLLEPLLKAVEDRSPVHR